MTNEELRLENDRLKVRVGELEDRFVQQYDVALKLAEKRIAELESQLTEAKGCLGYEVPGDFVPKWGFKCGICDARNRYGDGNYHLSATLAQRDLQLKQYDDANKWQSQRISELEEATRKLENRAALMTEQRDAAMWCEEEAKKRIAKLEALCLRF